LAAWNSTTRDWERSGPLYWESQMVCGRVSPWPVRSAREIFCLFSLGTELSTAANAIHHRDRTGAHRVIADRRYLVISSRDGGSAVSVRQSPNVASGIAIIGGKKLPHRPSGVASCAFRRVTTTSMESFRKLGRMPRRKLSGNYADRGERWMTVQLVGEIVGRRV